MVSESESSPVPGQIARVLKGRDAGNYCVVVNVLDHRFVEIADGDKRKFDRAKRKNVYHLELQERVSAEVQNSLLETGKVTNGKLRFALNEFLDDLLIKQTGGTREDESING